MKMLSVIVRVAATSLLLVPIIWVAVAPSVGVLAMYGLCAALFAWLGLMSVADALEAKRPLHTKRPQLPKRPSRTYGGGGLSDYFENAVLDRYAQPMRADGRPWHKAKENAYNPSTHRDSCRCKRCRNMRHSRAQGDGVHRHTAGARWSKSKGWHLQSYPTAFDGLPDAVRRPLLAAREAYVASDAPDAIIDFELRVAEILNPKPPAVPRPLPRPLREVRDQYITLGPGEKIIQSVVCRDCETATDGTGWTQRYCGGACRVTDRTLPTLDESRAAE